MRDKLPEPPENFLDIKISYSCNFKCEYCYQVINGKRVVGVLKKEHINSLASYIERTGLIFHVTLAGGEPFVYPHLNYIADKLIEKKQFLRIITNFSAPIEKIKDFLQRTNGFLEYMSISVHLSQWQNLENFYEKVIEINNFIKANNISVKLCFTCVLIEEYKDKTKSLLERMNEYGYAVEVQRVYYNSKYELYSEDTEKYFRAKGLDVPQEVANNTNFYGRYCHAGKNFLYIESNGDVFRCYTSQKNDKLYKLGSLNEAEKILLLKEVQPCLSIRNCICFKHFIRKGFLTHKYASKHDINRALRMKQTLKTKILEHLKKFIHL